MAACYWNPEQIISADILHSDYVPPDDQYAGKVVRTINNDASVAVIMDGEIYNIDLLRRELEADDHDFYTTDDAEVVLHLYELYGPEVLFPKLRGKFSIAIWDARRQYLLLARDRTGQKPLYVYQDDEKLIFASELKAILAHGDVKRDINPTAIEDYFIMECVPAPRSIYKNVEKIPAASWKIFRPLWGKELQPGDAWISNENTPRRYWRFEITEDPSVEEIDEAQWKQIIIDTLEDAVDYMKGGFIPAGAFLSGGLDSSIVVAIQSRWGGESISTFSIGFSESEFNELEYAEAVSERFGTDHYEEIVTPNAVAELARLVECYDEPFGDPAALPMMLVSRLAAKYVTAVFSGDGGDESFGGYARHIHDMREDHVRRLLPRGIQSLLGGLGALWPRTDFLPKFLRAKSTLTNLGLSAAEAYANTASYCRNPLQKKLLAPLFRTAGYVPSDVKTRYIEEFLRAPSDDTLAGMLMAEVNFALPEAMTKVDRATMHYGLEVRSPFLDHEMLAVAAKVPSGLKIEDGLGKWILRKIFEPQLPEKLKNRPKQGFELPTDTWMRGPLKQIFMDEVFHKNSRLAEWVDIAAAKKIYEHHCARTGQHGRFLWSLLVLAEWVKRWG